MISGSGINDHCSGFESGADLTPSTEAPTEPWEECELRVSPRASLLLGLGEALDSSQYAPPLRIFRGPLPVEALHLRPTDLSAAALLGRIVVRYGRVPMWPTTLLVCKTTYTVLCTSWKLCRAQPRDEEPRDHGNWCDICGWLTHNRSIDEELCDECAFNGICEECSHICGGRRLCDWCMEPRDLSPARRFMMMILADINNAFQCFTLTGPYFTDARGPGCDARSCLRAWSAVARGWKPLESGLGLFYYVSLEEVLLGR